MSGLGKRAGILVVTRPSCRTVEGRREPPQKMFCSGRGAGIEFTAGGARQRVVVAFRGHRNGREPTPLRYTMTKELMEMVLPRLAQRLNRHLRRYREGQLDDAQFSDKFETLLQQQYSWLARRGIPELEAAFAIHSAVLVLSGPGLLAEAQEEGIPLEVIEFRAAQCAAADISQNYRVSERGALRRICGLVAAFAQ